MGLKKEEHYKFQSGSGLERLALFIKRQMLVYGYMNFNSNIFSSKDYDDNYGVKYIKKQIQKDCSPVEIYEMIKRDYKALKEAQIKKIRA